MWLPLSWALNMVNRSMGKQDVYPFVLPGPVLEKMRFIHTIVDEVSAHPEPQGRPLAPERRRGVARGSCDTRPGEAA